VRAEGLLLCRAASVLALVAVPFAGWAQAPATGWVVGKTADSPDAMVRTLEGVTVDYHLVPGDYDVMKVSVKPCGTGDDPWYIKDSLSPPGETSAERLAFLRKNVLEDIHNARLNCPIPDGIEDRLLDGFDAAYAQFEKLNPDAQTH